MGSQESKQYVGGSNIGSPRNYTDQHPAESTLEDQNSKIHRETTQLSPISNVESSKTHDFERSTEGASKHTDSYPVESTLVEQNSKIDVESSTEDASKHTDSYPVESTLVEQNSKVDVERSTEDASKHTDSYPVESTLVEQNSKVDVERSTEDTSKHTDSYPVESTLVEQNSKVDVESSTEDASKHTDSYPVESTLVEQNSKVDRETLIRDAQLLPALNEETLKTHDVERSTEGASKNTDSNPVKLTLEKQNSKVDRETPINNSNNSATSKTSPSLLSCFKENESFVVSTDFTDQIISEQVVSAGIQTELPKKENNFFIKSTEPIDNIVGCESSFEVNVEKENINSNTNLGKQNLFSDLIAPKNVKVNFKSTEYCDSQKLEWSTDIAIEYLSKVSSFLNQIKSLSPSNVNLNDLSDLENSTSYLANQLQRIEGNTQNYEDNTVMKRQNYVLCIADVIKLNELQKKYKFLSIQPNISIYCTLCKVSINCDLQNNDYSRIENHLKSVLHKETEIDASVQIKEDESNVSAQYLKKILLTEYENQKEYLKIVDQIVKCTLCEEIWRFDVNLSVIENHFKKESHLSLCRSLRIENNLQENYRNAMEFIKTNMPSVELNFPTTAALFYICCLCDFVTSTIDVWRNHVKAEFDCNVANRINCYCCDSCKVVLLGVVDIYKEHCLLTTHKQLKNESDEGEEGKQLGLIVPNHFEKCNIPKEERISTHENFLNKIVKNYSEITNHGQTKGFYCSVCNIYMFYGQNRIEHTDMHVHPDSKLPVKVSQLFCMPCNIDLYCEDYLGRRTRKEHMLLPSHHVMAKAVGFDPNDIALIFYRDATTDLNLTSDNVLVNVDELTENNNSDTELPEKFETKKDCATGENLEKISGKTKKIMHEDFIKKIVELYHGEDAIGQKEIPRRGFYCEICNIYRFYGPKLKKHKLKHPTFDSSVENETSIIKCKLFTCKTCNVDLYGEAGLLKQHNTLSSHKKMENEIVYDADSKLAYQIKKDDKTVTKELSFNNKIQIEKNYASVMNNICSRITPDGLSLYSPLNSSSFKYICIPCDFVTNCNGVFKDHCRNDNHEGLSRSTCGCCYLVMFGTPAVIFEHDFLSQHVYIKEMVANLLEFPLSETPDSASQHGVFLEKMFKLYKDSKTDRNGFYCKICNRYGFYSTKFKNVHTKTKHHLRTELVINNSNICQEFYCQSCKVDLFGPCDVLTDHFGFSAHKIMAGLEDDANENLSSNIYLSNYEENQENISGSCKNLGEDVILKTKIDGFNKIAANISPELVVPEETRSIPNANDSRITTQEFDETATVSTVNNVENYATAGTNSSSSEIQKNDTQSSPFNVLHKDQNHIQLMTFVAKSFFKVPKSRVPKIVAYLCEAHKECIYDKLIWDEHINVMEHKEFGSNFCTVCRVSFLSTEDYFKNHLLSYGHRSIKQICMQRRISILEQDEEEEEATAAQSDDDEDDESSSSSEQTDEDVSIKEEKKTKNKRKRNKPKMKQLGLIVQGYHPRTQPNEFHKIFGSMGFKVKYVTNYKKISGAALVMFDCPGDVDSILEMKKPITMNGMELQITSLKLKGKGDPARFHISANLQKLFHSPAIFMGVIDTLIFRYSSSAEIEAKKTNQVLVDIKQSLRNVDVYPFGSRIYGTTSLTSDLDVFVDIDGETYFDDSTFKDRRLEENIIHNIANDLKRSKAFQQIAVIPARVPIVRLVHRQTHLACDVSSLSGLSVENTKLTKCYLESDPRVAWLVTAVKYWADQNSLKDSSRFTSYALTWMVLYFLMQLDEPVVFPVETLRKLKYTPKPPITGWDCQFCADVKLYPKTKNTQLVLELLHDFFVFYATVDHANCVFCPIVGKAIHRDKFKQFDLPECFQRYVNKIKITREHIQLNKPFCLQDPLDLGHNVTKNVKKDLLNYFKSLCIKSAKMCEEW